MSVSASHGFKVLSDSLQLTSAMQLHISTSASDDGIKRRPKSIWKMSHTSGNLEKTQIHLFNPGPSTDNDAETFCNTNISDKSFFAGLSRLIYTCESHRKNRLFSWEEMLEDFTATKSSPIHRLTVHEFKGAWTIANRNICLAIAEGVGKAHILRKILNNEALKMFKIDDKDQTSLNRATYDRNCTIVRNENIDIEASYDERISELGSTSFNINTGQKQGHNRSVSGGENDECYDTLKRFIEESETNLIGHSEDEEVKNPVELLNGVALCEGTDDIILTNWQIDFLHSQLLLKCRMKSGFILVTAAQATVTQRIHCPVWRHTQLLMKRSWTAKLSQLQYFAPLLNVGQAPAPTSPSTQPPTSQPSNQIPIIKTTNEDENVDDENINCDISSINEPTTSAESNEMDERVSETERSSKKTSSNVNFYWLSRNLIEQKHMGTTTEKSNKISDLLASGEAVGGIVYDVNNPQSVNTNFQLQRMASRCSCQLFFCYFSDIIDTEEMEQNDVIIKPMKPSHQSSNKADGWKGHKQDDVDTFTLKHNILEVSTNPEQYQMCLDIVNHLILFVDPKKNESERFRRNLSLELAKKSKQEVRETIETKQNELRDVISVFRLLERKAYFLRKGKHPKASETDEIVTPEVAFDNEQFERSLEVYKAQQNSLIDELATMISCLKEKEVEDQIEVRLKQLKSAPDDEDESTIARKFEVFFENCIWRQTESDGQISIAETQIRNFLYTRTARIDYSGDHLLEIGVVKMLNLIPNSKYKEALTRLHDPHVVPTSSTTNNVKTPSIRVICREAPPVGGVYTNDHFEVNVAPMQVQITYRFFEKMMNYFFPGKNIDYEDGKNLDDHDSIDEQQLSHQPQTSQQQQPETPQNLSFARKVTNSLSSFRRKGELIIRPDRFSKGQQRQDESDKLKERSEKNKFVYIIIPAVPFIVSYKGTKEKSILDVEHFCLYFPICEYHNKDWTWLELALAIKQRCKRMLLQQVTQRLLRIHPRQGPLLTPEPLDDEAKRRMLLGSNVTTPISKEKK